MKQKVTSEEKRKLKNSQNKEWSKKNPHKVKEYNEFHRKIRMEKIFTKRKNELDYDNHTWYEIPNTDFFINEELTIINKFFKRIKINYNKVGYQIVTINGSTTMYHRVIASVFIPNPENKKEINHINGIKSDNRIENLEWSTRSENVRHSFDVLGKKSNLIGWRQKKQNTLNNSKVSDI